METQNVISFAVQHLPRVTVIMNKIKRNALYSKKSAYIFHPI